MKWLYKDNFIPFGVQSRISNSNYYKLVIPHVQLIYAGTYECLGYDDENHRFQCVGVLDVTGE